MGDINRKFGSNVRKIRLKDGLTQAEAARRCGMNFKHFQRIEYTNPPDVRLTTVARIAKGLNTTVIKLFS